MVMTPEEQIFSLMSAAEGQQKTVTELLESLNAGLTKLDDTRRQLEAGVTRAAQRGVGEALAGAPAETAKALQAGSAALASAAGRAEAVARRLGWQTFGIVALSCLTAVLGALTLGWYITPSPFEIEALRADKAALEANIADLARRGGRVKLEKCGKPIGRLCVEVDEKAGSFGDETHGFRVVKGY